MLENRVKNGNADTVFALNPNLQLYFVAEDGEKFSNHYDLVKYSANKELNIESVQVEARKKIKGI